MGQKMKSRDVPNLGVCFGFRGESGGVNNVPLIECNLSEYEYIHIVKAENSSKSKRPIQDLDLW